MQLQAQEHHGELDRSSQGDARLAERAHGVEDEIEGRGACFGRRFQNRGDALRGDFAEESESQVDLRGGHGLGAGEAREGRAALRQRLAPGGGRPEGKEEAPGYTRKTGANTRDARKAKVWR